MSLSTQAPLSTAECVARLRQAPLARVLLSIRCLPAALPVTLVAVDEASICLSSSSPDVWQAGLDRDVFTIYVDGQLESGQLWSVAASGIGSVVTEGFDDVTTNPESRCIVLTRPLLQGTLH